MTEKRKREGARLRDARKAMGFSQVELAEEIGASRSAVSMYERGARSLSKNARDWLLHFCGAPAQSVEQPAAVERPARRVRRMGWPAAAR